MPDFDDSRECGGLVLFMLVRLIKVAELFLRAVSTCRGVVRGRPAMMIADFCVALFVFFIISVGAGRACEERKSWPEWYADSVGTCDWRVTVAMFWTGFFELIYSLGHREDFVTIFNTYRQTFLKSVPCCLGVYGWQLWIFNFILDFIAAVILNTSGCHLGWGVVIAGPFGLFARWYAFGGGDGVIANEPTPGTEMPELSPSRVEAPPATQAGAPEGNRTEAGAPNSPEEPADTLSKDV